MFTSFTRDDTMLASELMHQVTMPIPAPLATLVRGELGFHPSFHSKVMDAWYARAIITDAECLDEVPFALRCDRNGNWFVSVSPFAEMDLAEAFATIVPGIEFIELRGRNARAA